MPAETAEEAHARGVAEGLAMLEQALAEARRQSAAERDAIRHDMSAALVALGETLAEELGALAQAIATRVLGAVPAAADAALLALAHDVGQALGEGAELRASAATAARLQPLLAGTAHRLVVDPALADGMVAARSGLAERVDSLPMRLERVATAIAEPSA